MRDERAPSAHEHLHRRARERGVNAIVYWLIRAVLQPVFHLYFRLSRIGREHVPQEGPVIFAANHRSFLDPFVIATITRRPLYYVAKRELFEMHPVISWLLNALGAFPVDRGNADADMITTAKAILARGDSVLIFPEGTRIRPGSLGRPRRGVGRLALETGAPVVPVAVFGTEDIRKKWRIRPHKVRIRVGAPVRFPAVEHPSRQLAAAVTDRIWPCVMLQWEWLGGLPPLRRAAVIGDGPAAAGRATLLARAGIEVDHGGRLELSAHDLVVFATPADDLPAAVAAHGGAIPPRAGVLVTSKGLVAPLGTLPAAYVAERTLAWSVASLGGPLGPEQALDGGASVLIASPSPAFARQVTDAFLAAGLDATPSDDLVGVGLAGVARHAAALAASTAAGGGGNAAGAAAGKVFAEVEGLARREGADTRSLVGLAGVGDLTAALLAPDPHDADALGCVGLLAARARDARVQAPVLSGLADVLEGRCEPEAWSAGLTEPRRPSRARAA